MNHIWVQKFHKNALKPYIVGSKVSAIFFLNATIYKFKCYQKALNRQYFDILRTVGFFCLLDYNHLHLH